MTDTAPSLVRRLRVTTAVVALVALAFSQAPGKLIGDTKSDLVLDPGTFLRRALAAAPITVAARAALPRLRPSLELVAHRPG